MSFKNQLFSRAKRFNFCFILLASILLLGCSTKKGHLEEKIHWENDVPAAFLRARMERKPLLIDFMATWCPPCQEMEASTFSSSDIISRASEFVTVRVDVDQQGDLARSFKASARKYGGIGIPNILFLSPDSEKIRHVLGYQSADALSSLMDSVLTVVNN